MYSTIPYKGVADGLESVPLTAELEISERYASRVDSMIRTHFFARVFDYGTNCPDRPLRKRSETGPIHRGGRALIDREASEPMPIPVGHFIAIRGEYWASTFGAQTHCTTDGGFIPSAGSRYHVRVRLGTGQCTLELTDGNGRAVDLSDHEGCRALFEGRAD